MMNIHLIRTKNVSNELYAKVFDLLISSQGPLEFKQHRPEKNYHDSIVSWDDLFHTCHQFRENNHIPQEDFVILMTNTRNTKNWFSACEPNGENSVFILTAEWDNYLDCNAEYPIAYEVVENIIERMMAANLEEMFQIAHDPPIGCISDMCSWKPDIIYKLRTADICHDCLNLLNEKCVDHEIIKQAIEIFENIRSYVLMSRSFRELREMDDSLPFPVAITRRKMNLARYPLHKFLCLIDHFDSIVRISVIIIGNILLGNRFDSFYTGQELDNRPSLGHWVAALTKLAKYEDDIALINFNLPDDTLERIQKIVAYENQEHIVQLRNERRGHSYQECYGELYQKDFEENIGIISSIEKILKPILTRCLMVYVSNLTNCGEGTFKLSVYKLMGSHPDFLEEEQVIHVQTLDDLPISGKVYIYIANNHQWINLSPYVLFGECSLCAHSRVLVNDGGDVYLDPYIGHRVRSVR